MNCVENEKTFALKLRGSQEGRKWSRRYPLRLLRRFSSPWGFYTNGDHDLWI